MSNRKQFVHFNGETSSNLGVTFGVPQRFALRPLLFLQYINDLTHLENHGYPVLYAEDTTIVGELKTIYIHVDLKAVEFWMSQKKLTKNQSKTKVITFGLNTTSELKWNEEQTGYGKLLGVGFGKDLEYLEHLRVIKNKCNRFISLFYQTNTISSTSWMINILKTNIQPLHQKGCVLYGTASKNHLWVLQRQQNYLIRLIFGLKRSDQVITYQKSIPLSRYLSVIYTNCLNNFAK